MELKHLERITCDPAIMGGKPCIRGMRVTVGMLETRHDKAGVLELYPYLEPADIDQTLSCGALRAEEIEIHIAAACCCRA